MGLTESSGHDGDWAGGQEAQLLQQLPGKAVWGIVQPLQLPGSEGRAVQLRQLVPQFLPKFVQLRQLLQQLHEQLLFVGDGVDRRGHGGGDEGVVRLLQLDDDLGLLHHDGRQLGLVSQSKRNKGNKDGESTKGNKHRKKNKQVDQLKVFTCQECV